MLANEKIVDDATRTIIEANFINHFVTVIVQSFLSSIVLPKNRMFSFDISADFPATSRALSVLCSTQSVVHDDRLSGAHV